MPSSPVTEKSDLVSFTILSNGKEIPDTYEILSICTEQFLNKIASAEIVLADGNAAKGTFPVSDSTAFKPGSKIEIKLGYYNTNESIFKGLVIKQNLKIRSGAGSCLHVICKDTALKMTVNRNNAIYNNTTDSDIMKGIVENAGLTSEVIATNIKHKEIVQYGATDWDFLVTRAEVNGLVVQTDSGKLVISKPDVSTNPELEVTFGQDIIEFDGELDATSQYEAAVGSAWNMSTQKMNEAISSEPSINKQGNISGKTLSEVLGSKKTQLNSSTEITENDLSAWTNAAILKSRLSRFKGIISFQGSAKAVPNSLIELKGLGDRFNGNAFISGVTHIIENGTWLTEVQLGLSSVWFVETYAVAAPIASGLIPGISGLQTGVIKKTTGDPDNQFRVQVEIPVLEAESKTVWARLSTFYASNSFGAYFMPEIGDEVILGFMNDDPRFPIILGSVYSSTLPAPETPDEENSIKTLVTKSKLQLKFDDAKKEVTVQTPAGNTIVMSDEGNTITICDTNANKIEMNAKGILLDSASNIKIKAADEVNIEGSKVCINGDQSVEVSGGNIAISADMSASLKGSAECTISSDGNLSAKGLMVNIN